MELEVPPFSLYNKSMLDKKEIEQTKIGSTVMWNGEEYWVVRFAEGYAWLVTANAPYSVKLEELTAVPGK